MKKNFFSIILVVFVYLLFSSQVSAFMMGRWNKDSFVSQEIINHTKKEEAEGKEIWEKLKSGKINCSSLKDEDFALLGEYFMGVKTGDSHPFMNQMMVQMMGEKGEEQAHINLGKRYSGCFGNTSFNLSKGGDFSMMGPWMMGNFGMMGGLGFGLFGVYWILVSILILLVLILLVVYLWKKINQENKK